MIITIDGPAASGKSTISKLVAKSIGFLHFNSGSLFRGITAYLYSIGHNFENIKPDTRFSNIKLEVKYIDNDQHVFVNGVDFYNNLRDNHISTLTPIVSENKDLRAIIDKCQKEFCESHNIVIEGRDVGSYVFPNAEIKIFLDCSVSVRAKRRFEQEKAKNNKITLEEIEAQIKARDDFDKNKTIAPFVVPKGAFIVDSSNLNIEETLKAVLANIKLN